MVISSTTPESRPNSCPVCDTDLIIEPSTPTGDAPCPRCGHLLWFTCDDSDDVRVLRLTGDLSQTEWLDRLVDAIAIAEGTRMVIDLDQIPYLSSDALARFLKLKRKVATAGGKLTLRNANPDLREVFRITRLDQVLTLED